MSTTRLRRTHRSSGCAGGAARGRPRAVAGRVLGLADGARGRTTSRRPGRRRDTDPARPRRRVQRDARPARLEPPRPATGPRSWPASSAATEAFLARSRATSTTSASCRSRARATTSTDAAWSATATATGCVVEVTLQLEGYDAAPVITRDRFRFAPADDERLRPHLGHRRRLGEAQRRPAPAVGPRADRGPGGGRRARASSTRRRSQQPGRCVRSVERGIGDVLGDGALRLVAHRSSSTRLSDTDFLATSRRPARWRPRARSTASRSRCWRAGRRRHGRVDPVRAATRRARPARTERDRLVRHELTHVAVGDHDDQAPVWLSEGLAEYVSVRPLAPEERRLPDAALDAAEAGVADLPADATVQRRRLRGALRRRWWACEYIAATFGERHPVAAARGARRRRTPTRTRCSSRSSRLDQHGRWPARGGQADDRRRTTRTSWRRSRPEPPGRPRRRRATSPTSPVSMVVL